jgi:hypothetical protein
MHYLSQLQAKTEHNKHCQNNMINTNLIHIMFITHNTKDNIKSTHKINKHKQWQQLTNIISSAHTNTITIKLD